MRLKLMLNSTSAHASIYSPLKKIGNDDCETKMAVNSSDSLSLQKGSICQVCIEDITNNVLMVVLSHGLKTYRGVLLDQTYTEPYGLNRQKDASNEENVKNMMGMTSDVRPGGHEIPSLVEESSLSLRSTYQDKLPDTTSKSLPSPFRAMSRPLQDKNIRQRMLRPRHVLCSKCKSFCNDGSDKSSDSPISMNLMKRKTDNSDSNHDVTIPKRVKKETKLVTSKTIQDYRPVIKISFSSSNDDKRSEVEKGKGNNSHCHINEKSPEKVGREGVMNHSPSVLLHRIDCSPRSEKRELLQDCENVNKDHKHRHKKKRKKHKHRTSTESSHKRKHHRHKKRVKPEKDFFPLKHSNDCLKLKPKLVIRSESCFNIETPVIDNVVSLDDLDRSEESSSHSIENYKLNLSGDHTPLHLDGYSDTDSTDTYDFPQMEFPGVDSESESSTDPMRPLMMRIQTRNVFKCAIPDGRIVTVGDIVWGKIHGFPAWPGRVISITIRQRDNGVPISQIAHVSWFGSRTRSHMPLSDLYPFVDDYKLKFNKKKKGPYKIAVKQAWLAAQQSLPDFQDVDIEG